MTRNKQLLERDDIDVTRATKARDVMEHEILPGYFYGLEGKSLRQFLVTLSNPGEFLAHLHRNLRNDLVKEGNNYPQTEYEPTDFDGVALIGPNPMIPEPDVVIVRVVMPEPERPNLCARMFFCVAGEGYSRRKLYMTEKAEISPEDKKGQFAPPDCVVFECGRGTGSKEREGLELVRFSTGIRVYSGENLELKTRAFEALKGVKSQEELDKSFKNYTEGAQWHLIHALFMNKLG